MTESNPEYSKDICANWHDKYSNMIATAPEAIAAPLELATQFITKFDWTMSPSNPPVADAVS